MSEKTDYVAIYKKDPFSVSFNVDNMRNGHYLIKGEVSEENWFDTCKQINVPAFGQCYAICTVDKKGNVIRIFGELKTTMTRNCVRTLEDFTESEVLKFKEQMYVEDREGEEMAVVLNGAILDMKEYLTQQIILNMNAYPVHPKTKSMEKGNFGVDDGQEKALLEEKEKKNPFSVLKDLKSNS